MGETRHQVVATLEETQDRLNAVIEQSQSTITTILNNTNTEFSSTLRKVQTFTSSIPFCASTMHIKKVQNNFPLQLSLPSVDLGSALHSTIQSQKYRVVVETDLNISVNPSADLTL